MSDEDITLPILKYGYRTTPMGWNELLEIIEANDLAKLSRSESQQREYELYKRRLLQQYTSVRDFILCDKFGFPAVADKASGRLSAPSSDSSEVRSVLVKNDFPYFMSDNIEHWILWKLNAICTEDDIRHAKEQLEKQLNNVKGTQQWINPPHLQSLPEIDHVHILVLRDP